MDGKDSLCKIINSLLEMEKPMNKEILLDFVLGRETPAIKKRGFENAENFACGDDKEEEHWTEVIEQATQQGYLKAKSENVSATAKAKKFLKKPTHFELKGEDEEAEFEKESVETGLNKMVEDIMFDSTSQNLRPVSTQRKMAIIQAIDRKVALDEFATAQGMDFDEVMTDVENLMASGTHLDLSYFAEEVLGEECIEELMEYFKSAETDSLNKAMDEYGDVYSEDELRLGRAIWRSKHITGKKKK